MHKEKESRWGSLFYILGATAYKSAEYVLRYHRKSSKAYCAFIDKHQKCTAAQYKNHINRDGKRGNALQMSNNKGMWKEGEYET